MPLISICRVCFVVALICSIQISFIHAQTPSNNRLGKYGQVDKFRQLEEVLPTPNDYRIASGAPGHRYWQQQVDYRIDIDLNDDTQTLTGAAEITYTNRSPDALRYVWLQLDPNIREPHSDSFTTQTRKSSDQMTLDGIAALQHRRKWDGGIKISGVRDSATGEDLKYTIVKTMMRIDLPVPLAKGDALKFKVDWKYQLNDSKLIWGRTGFEKFEEDGNYIYEVAQWYPRACAYTDVNGWQHKQFLGRGEFTLDFGNYEVNITVPDDHVVASTGVLQNPEEVLTAKQIQRLESAKEADEPEFIITPEEAKENESSTPSGTKTWTFKAENVRDFAFASSRKFAWDAMGVQLQDKTVMAMSYFPNEGEPLWSKYSTHAVAHAVEVYSKFTFDYPYPVAISVNGPVYGMEYPMICFNGPRPEKDGTYSKRTKYGLISVIIHEVGHNWFPMIVNSDERQWTWMDEGLNSFVQYLTEQEWEEDYPSRISSTDKIVPYMISGNQVPIMTNSESILQFGPNAYAKPAMALNILRETIMGRAQFDFAFKEYANRWRFKRPMPSDFFRTMEDASGIDLDWFWRGWFYTTDHVDIAVTGIRAVEFDTETAYIEKPKKKAKRDAEGPSLATERNADLAKRIWKFSDLHDFYNTYDELDITPQDKKAYEAFLKKLTDSQKATLAHLPNAYVVDFQNVGGLVMPLILELTFEDGSTELRRIPAEIWRHNNKNISKLMITEKRLVQVEVDPHQETADAAQANNFFPRRIEPLPMKLKPGRPPRGSDGKKNPMQKQREAAEKDADKDEVEASDEPTAKDGAKKKTKQGKKKKPASDS